MPLAILGSPVGASKDCVVARLRPADQGLEATGREGRRRSRVRQNAGKPRGRHQPAFWRMRLHRTAANPIGECATTPRPAFWRMRLHRSRHQPAFWRMRLHRSAPPTRILANAATSKRPTTRILANAATGRVAGPIIPATRRKFLQQQRLYWKLTGVPIIPATRRNVSARRGLERKQSPFRLFQRHA